jgi:hypothetical protein
MDQPAAIKVTFVNFKNIVGRKQLQLHFEIPIEQAGLVYSALGWPDAADPKWCVVALLNEDKP